MKVQPLTSGFVEDQKTEDKLVRMDYSDRKKRGVAMSGSRPHNGDGLLPFGQRTTFAVAWFLKN